MAARTAVELAKLIRGELEEPTLRLGVYSCGAGWRARVYADPDAAAELQKRGDVAVERLRQLYELDDWGR